jgi:hypothetical protein
VDEPYVSGLHLLLRGSEWTPAQELTAWLCQDSLAPGWIGYAWCNFRGSVVPNAAGTFRGFFDAPDKFSIFLLVIGTVDCRARSCEWVFSSRDASNFSRHVSNSIPLTFP